MEMKALRKELELALDVQRDTQALLLAQVLTLLAVLVQKHKYCPCTTICVSSYCFFMCPCTTIYVSLYYCMCVLKQMEEQRALHAAHEALKEQLDREHRQKKKRLTALPL